MAYLGDCDDSDSDHDSERACLEVMTSDGQDIYLRLGLTPRRRSALRLSRIIARQLLLRRLEQGRGVGLLHSVGHLRLYVRDENVSFGYSY